MLTDQNNDRSIYQSFYEVRHFVLTHTANFFRPERPAYSSPGQMRNERHSG